MIANDWSNIINLLSPSDAAKILAVSRSTIYRWFWKGKLKGVKFADIQRIRILESSIHENTYESMRMR